MLLRKTPEAVAMDPTSDGGGNELCNQHDPYGPVLRSRHPGKHINHPFAGTNCIPGSTHAYPEFEEYTADDHPHDPGAENGTISCGQDDFT